MNGETCSLNGPNTRAMNPLEGSRNRGKFQAPNLESCSCKPAMGPEERLQPRVQVRTSTPSHIKAPASAKANNAVHLRETNNIPRFCGLLCNLHRRCAEQQK